MESVNFDGFFHCLHVVELRASNQTVLIKKCFQVAVAQVLFGVIIYWALQSRKVDYSNPMAHDMPPASTLSESSYILGTSRQKSGLFKADGP